MTYPPPGTRPASARPNDAGKLRRGPTGAASGGVGGHPALGTSKGAPGNRHPAPGTSNGAPRVSTSVVRVRYAETDKMGIVYYAHYLVWFEIGRTEWLRETGWTYRAMEDEGLGLPVIEAQCKYKSGARYDDDLEIRTRARLVSPVRLAFDYDVVRKADAVTIASGYTVHATVDRSGRPVRLPARVKDLLA